MIKKDKKVIIAMSGGVDSSVAAALLKKQKFEVTGIFMRFWKEPEKDICYPYEGEMAARRVARKLQIPLQVINLEKRFKKGVVDYFLTEQARGRTPNPCVICNPKIKFQTMLKKALEFEADFVATGHYARIAPSKLEAESSKLKVAAKNLKLLKAIDKTKDQSYFLYRLNQKQLSKIIFPLGNLTKNDVMKIAKEWKLPCQKEQSFDMCFIKSSHESFIRKYLKLKSGKILRYAPHLAPFSNKRKTRNEILGWHDGLALYTIGQRKSIPVSQGPWWVVKKDEQKNILYVSNEEKDLYCDECLAGQVCWLSGVTPKLPTKVWAKIRYKSEASEATVMLLRGLSSWRGNKAVPPLSAKERSGYGVLPSVGGGTLRYNILKVVFKKPQRAITPGQSVVFYTKNGEVLGGGIIK